jgi:hypothetical protein
MIPSEIRNPLSRLIADVKAASLASVEEPTPRFM